MIKSIWRWIRNKFTGGAKPPEVNSLEVSCKKKRAMLRALIEADGDAGDIHSLRELIAEVCVPFGF